MSTGAWTNNWQGIKNSMILGAVSRNGVATVYNTSGALVYASYINSPLYPVRNGFSPSGSYNSIRFGTSDTAPAATDTDLGNQWSENITYVKATYGNITWNGAKATRTFTVTVQNTAAATVTVREWGLFCQTSNGYAMLYRGILDSPVAIAQYESATIQVTVDLTIEDPI